MGLKIFEYLASRTPIVASDMPLNKEFFHDGENAILFKADDPESLAKEIKEILADKKLARSISANAVKDSKKYSYKARAKKIIKFISQGE